MNMENATPPQTENADMYKHVAFKLKAQNDKLKAENAALRSVISEKDRQLEDSKTIKALPPVKGGGVPSFKRDLRYQIQLATARELIEDGEIRPTLREILGHKDIKCHSNTARAIINDLVKERVLVRLRSGRVRVNNER